MGLWPTPLPLNFIFCSFLPESPIHIQSLCDIRDYGKKLQQLEISFDETNDKLTNDNDEVESDISAHTRMIMFIEEEDKTSAEQVCQTATKLDMTF